MMYELYNEAKGSHNSPQEVSFESYFNMKFERSAGALETPKVDIAQPKW